MSGEIKIFNNDGLHGLLVGRQPHIGHSQSIRKDNNATKNEYVDFSKFSFPELIEPTSKKVSRTDVDTPSKNTTNVYNTEEFSKLREDSNFLQKVENYLNIYEENHNRKAMMLHQELEDHYLRPVSRKITTKVNGPEYQRYLKSRLGAITAFDKLTRTKDSYLKDLPKIPTLSYDTSDLVDPVLKYKRNIEREKKLTHIIEKQTGILRPVKKLNERDTMNLRKWQILAETRFYDGEGNETANQKKGKKFFADKFVSKSKECLDQFAPIPERTNNRVNKYKPLDCPFNVDY